MSSKPKRIIFFDLETTGFNYSNGDKIIQFGAIETIDSERVSSREILINPKRPIPAEASAVHGIFDKHVNDQPSFEEVAEEIQDFLQNAQLVAHNGRRFDLPFINFQFAELGLQTLKDSNLVDTLEEARRIYRGKSNSLDALCKRFKIDSSSRKLHSALLDTELLFKVYNKLFIQQNNIVIDNDSSINKIAKNDQIVEKSQVAPIKLSLLEKKEHQDFLENHFSKLTPNRGKNND